MILLEHWIRLSIGLEGIWLAAYDTVAEMNCFLYFNPVDNVQQKSLQNFLNSVFIVYTSAKNNTATTSSSA